MVLLKPHVCLVELLLKQRRLADAFAEQNCAAALHGLFFFILCLLLARKFLLCIRIRFGLSFIWLFSVVRILAGRFACWFIPFGVLLESKLAWIVNNCPLCIFPGFCGFFRVFTFWLFGFTLWIFLIRTAFSSLFLLLLFQEFSFLILKLWMYTTFEKLAHQVNLLGVVQWRGP